MPASSRKRSYPLPSLRTRGSIHTVRLQALMDAAQKAEIGERIRDLRNASRETGNRETNRSIADYCGVSVEAVRNWIAGKGITYDNATKVAELFQVDRDWLWRGREKGETPDLMGALSAGSESELGRQIAELQSETTELRSELSEVRSDLQDVLSLLRRGTRGQEGADS